MSETCDIAIIGAGAAGLAAGIFAAEAALAGALPAPRILLLDGARTIGAKILVSGGGRCNVTHERIVPEDYAGPRTIVRNILAAFNEKAAVRWMQSIGVELKRMSSALVHRLATARSAPSTSRCSSTSKQVTRS